MCFSCARRCKHYARGGGVEVYLLTNQLVNNQIIFGMVLATGNMQTEFIVKFFLKGKMRNDCGIGWCYHQPEYDIKKPPLFVLTQTAVKTCAEYLRSYLFLFSQCQIIKVVDHFHRKALVL